MLDRPTHTDFVYTPDDLARWPDAPARNEVSLAVLGHPVAHSASPAMHNAALAELAKNNPALANWRYYKFEVPPQFLKEALELFAHKGFRGLNLTLPLKVDILSLLEKSEPLPPSVQQAGAANTLFFANEAWSPFNTDIAGLRYGVEIGLGATIAGSDVVVLGTGGAARAAVACAGIHGAASVQVRSRSLDRARDFCASLQTALPNLKLQPIVANAPLPKDALVLNGTPLGLKPDDASPLDERLLNASLRLFDMTYGKVPSRLLQHAAARGARVCDGLPMLAAQGFYALAIWLENAGVSRPDETVYIPRMLEAARTANGMPPRT